mgnify:CR=1 FL=1
MAGWQVGAALGGLDRFGEHLEKLFAFVEQGRKLPSGLHSGEDNEAEPAAGFTHLLGRHAHFVGEIIPTFGGAPLVIIGCRCRAAAHQLTGHMASEAGIRQSIDDFSNPRRKTPKPLGEFL